MSRRVNVRVSPELVAGMLFPSFPGVWNRTDAGLPEGAKFIGFGHDWERNCLWFTFEHESFAEVRDGEIVPEFNGVSLHAFCFSSPATEADIAALNKLMEKQMETATANCGKSFGSYAVKTLDLTPRDMDCEDGGSPMAVVGS